MANAATSTPVTEATSFVEDESTMERIHKVMLKAVRVGSRVAVRAQRESQHDGKVSKPDASPVTVGDFAVQACISHILSSAFPDIKLLGEEDDEGFSRLAPELKADILQRIQLEIPTITDESAVASLIGRGNFGKNPSDKPPCFVLDPIDGTKGFIRGEQYAICLGYLSSTGTPTASVMGCPNMPKDFFNVTSDAPGYIFDALEGKGVRMRKLDRDDSPVLMEWTRNDSDKAKQAKLIFAESYEKAHVFGSLNQRLYKDFSADDEKDVLRIDSQVKFGALVRGDANIYTRFVPFDLCIWDVLPGYCLLIEAGGRVTDKNGEPINFTLGRTIHKNSLVATSAGMSHVHDRILEAIARLDK